jgi:hypothetical protein
MRCSSAAPMRNVWWHSSVMQQAAPDLAAARSPTPAAMPLRRLLATCALRHVRLRRQYITRSRHLGTLMRHDLCHRCRCRCRCRCWRRRRCAMQLALAITPRASGMGKAPRTPALVAPPRLAQRGTPRLCAALTAAVASPSIAHAAYQHLGLAACTDKHSRAHRPGLGPAARSGSRHRRSGSRPDSAPRSAPNRRRRRWTSAPAGAILCTHSWLTRWGAAAGITGLSLRLPRPFYKPTFYRGLACATSATRLLGGWGGTPQVKPSSFTTSQRQRCCAGHSRIPRAPAPALPLTPPARHDSLHSLPANPIASRALARVNPAFAGSILLSTSGSISMSAKGQGARS